MTISYTIKSFIDIGGGEMITSGLIKTGRESGRVIRLRTICPELNLGDN